MRRLHDDLDGELPDIRDAFCRELFRYSNLSASNCGLVQVPDVRVEAAL